MLESLLPLTGVVGQAEQGNLAFGEGHAFFKGHGLDFFHGVQATAQRGWRLVQQAPEQPLQPSIDIVVHIIHQLIGQRLRAADGLAGEAHLGQPAARNQVLQHAEHLGRKHPYFDLG